MRTTPKNRESEKKMSSQNDRIRNADWNLRSATDEMFEAAEELRRQEEAFSAAWSDISAAVLKFQSSWTDAAPQIIQPLKDMANGLFSDMERISKELSEKMESASHPETPQEQIQKAKKKKSSKE